MLRNTGQLWLLALFTAMPLANASTEKECVDEGRCALRVPAAKPDLPHDGQSYTYGYSPYSRYGRNYPCTVFPAQHDNPALDGNAASAAAVMQEVIGATYLGIDAEPSACYCSDGQIRPEIYVRPVPDQQCGQWATEASPRLENECGTYSPAAPKFYQLGDTNIFELENSYRASWGRACPEGDSDLGWVTINRSRTLACPAGTEEELVGSWQWGCVCDGACPGTPNQPVTGEKEFGCAGDSNTVGNPCNATTGNKYQNETDYSGGVLTWSRHYNSGSNLNGPLGFGWSHDFNRQLDIQDVDSLAMRRGSGQVLRFTRSNDLWSSDADVDPLLINNVNGFLVTHPGGEQEQYDAAGQLTWQQSPAGLRTLFSHSNGLLAGVTGPYGHTLSLVYDANQRISTVTDSGGGVISYSYDSNGNLISATRADGSLRTYHYEDATHSHALTGITDANGARFATWAYDGDGKAILSEHAVTTNGIGQEQFTLNYDSTTQTTVTNAAGDSEQITFSENLGVRNLTSRVFTADSKGISQTFDANNNKISRTDAESNTTAYTYNAFNQRTSMTEATGTAEARTTTYAYLSDDLDLPVTVTRDGVSGAQTHVTTTQYDAALNPTSITQSGFDASGSPVIRQTHVGYDGDGRLISIDGPRTDVSDLTTLTYHDCTSGNECGQLATTTNALGQTNSYTSYNPHGQVTNLTDANGIITHLAYDARQRLVQQTINGSRITDYSYDGVGQLTQLTLPDGTGFIYNHDDAHDLTRITDSAGHFTEYSYDAKGNRTTVTVQSSGGVIARDLQRGYDLRDYLIQLNDGSSSYNQTNDALGNTTDASDAKNQSATHSFDALNRLLDTTDRAGGTTASQFDVADRTTEVAAPNGAVTQYSYDDLDNLLSKQSPDRGAVTYQYDSVGNLTQLTDARGITVSYSYDALNRLTLTDYPGSDEDITYQYDSCAKGIGRLCQVTDQSGISSYQYSSFGEITQISKNEFGQTFITAYQYDPAGRISQLTYPSGRIVTYGRDARGLISDVTTTFAGTTGPVVSSRQYRADGLLTGQTLGNGLIQTRSFDTQARMTSQSLGTLWDQTLTHDPNGNLTDRNVNSATGTQTDLFSYDTLDRITDDTTQRGAFVYTYDASGNRLSKQIDGNSKTYDYTADSNRLTQANNKTVVLDAAGNTLTDKNGKREFAYNQGGRLSQYTEEGALKAIYTYNAFGQRTRKVKQTDIGAVTFTYHYDLQGHLIAEYKNGNLIRDYLWADDEPLMQVKIKQSNGKVGRTTWITTDHLLTPRIGTDENQTIVWKREGAAFGQANADKDPDGDGKDRNIRLRFPGQLADGESGLFYNWNRYYDPGTGRYITSDPIGLAGGINTYGYVGGKPLVRIDPRGLDDIMVHGFNVDNLPGTPAEAAAMQSSPLPPNANVIGLYGEAWVEFMSAVVTVNGARVITSCATKLLKVKPIQKLACTLGFTMAICQGKGDVAHDIVQQVKRSNDIAQGSRVSQRVTTHAPK